MRYKALLVLFSLFLVACDEEPKAKAENENNSTKQQVGAFSDSVNAEFQPFIKKQKIAEINKSSNPKDINNFRNPNHNGEVFHWDGYKSSKDFEEFLRKSFPIGSDKEYVEKMLMANPNTRVSPPETIAEQKNKTDGYIMGPWHDKILYSDPRFQNATTIIKYHNPTKRFFQLTSSSRIIMVFYDKDGHLLNLALYSEIIHKPLIIER